MNNVSHDSDLESELQAVLSHAGELGDVSDLIEIASRLHTDYVLPQPSAASISRGRERLLAAIAQKSGRAAAPVAPELEWRSRMQHWFAASNPFSRLMVSGVLAVLFLLMCNTVLTISAQSLPGDPLYSVKRAQEQVRFSLTLDEAQREQLQVQFDDARVKELEALQKQMRVVRTEVSGVVEMVNGRTIVIGDLALEVPAGIDLSTLRAGDRVVMIVETGHNGKVSVVELRVSEADTPPTVEPTETPRPSATASPSSTPRATATSVPTQAPHPDETEPPKMTPAPTQAPRATATERSEATETPRPPTVAPKPTDTHEATETPRPPGATPQPTDTREPTDTPRPPGTTPQPTDTHEATETPRPPTATPEPTRSR